MRLRFNMRVKAVFALLFLVAILIAAACHQTPPPVSVSPPTPSATPADIPLTSPAAFTAAIESRWPLATIGRFCSQGRRFWNGCQNLVAIPHCKQKGEIWEADLFKSAETGFDRVWWYATVCDNKIQTYSLNAQRGKDHWVIEIGDLARLAIPAEVEPPPNQCFEEGDRSGYK